jgi:deoxyribonuclease V
MPRTDAADLVGNMSGTARLPDALRLVDRLARAVPPGCSAEQMI